MKNNTKNMNCYTGNSRTNWKGSSAVGFTRCFLRPRWLPWFIRVFLCRLLTRSSLVTVIVGTVTVFFEWTTDIMEVAMTRRKRTKHVSEALACFTILLLLLLLWWCWWMETNGSWYKSKKIKDNDNFALEWSH